MPTVERSFVDGIVSAELNSAWVHDADVVANVMDEHFGRQVLGSELVPAADPVALRTELRRRARHASDLAACLLSFFSSGACAVIIPNAGLDALEVDLRSKLLYALAVLMGYPTGTDPRQRRVVWPVVARSERGGGFRTFSETDGEADYHTDTSYSLAPERFFLLYVVRQARCGGGVTALRPWRQVRKRLRRTAEGRKALQVLRRAHVPFRVPTIFTDDGQADALKHTIAPIIGTNGVLRWRRDTVEHGLSDLPQYDNSELRHALRVLVDALESPEDEVHVRMDDDSMVIVDNHETLHGRTAFRDHDRHLLRIRFHDQPETR